MVLTVLGILTEMRILGTFGFWRYLRLTGDLICLDSGLQDRNLGYLGYFLNLLG